MVANVGSTEAVKSAVKAGLGVSIVLADAVGDDVAAGRLAAVPIAGAALEKTFYIARPADLPDQDVTARFAHSLVGDPPAPTDG